MFSAMPSTLSRCLMCFLLSPRKPQENQQVSLNYCQISLIINVISDSRYEILFQTAHGGFMIC